MGADCLANLIERLNSGGTPGAYWDRVKGAFAALGSAWVTFGTTHRAYLDHPTILSDTPQPMMHDYMDRRLYEVDPWMQYCRKSTGIQHYSARKSSDCLGTQMQSFFCDHHVRYAAFLPLRAGARIGGVVLYATTADQETHLSRLATQRTAKVLASIAWVRLSPGALLAERNPEAFHPPILSKREVDVMSRLATGDRTAAIAHKLRLRPVTVSKHLANVRKKLQCRTREQALVKAMQLDLLQL